jgi:hypothetical protein
MAVFSGPEIVNDGLILHLDSIMHLDLGKYGEIPQI